MDRVPPSLADVVEPLREADGYRRLQLQRQRGVYNLLTGLPGLFFVLWVHMGNLVPYGYPDPYWELVVLLGQGGLLGLFFLACALPRVLLPWVRRRKPDWQAAILDASFLKRALEKLYWLQAILAAIAYLLPLPLFVGAYLLASETSLWIGLALFHAMGMTALALQARRTRDRLVEALYWIALPLGGLVLLIPSMDPLDFALRLLVVGLVVPPILAGVIRLLAPRRWLVR